jgi:putative peptidoglycan lipid II flippase
VAVLLRGYIVRLLFGFGDSTTADLLGWFAGAIVFYSLFFLIGRVFYAMQDTKTPLFTSLAAVALNVVLTVVLSRKYGIIGFPIAQSITSALEVLLLVVVLKRRLGTVGGKQILAGVSRMLVSAAIMAGVLYLLVSQVFLLRAGDKGLAVIGPKFGLLLAAAGLAYLIPCYVLRIKEAKLFITRLKSRVTAPVSLD